MPIPTTRFFHSVSLSYIILCINLYLYLCFTGSGPTNTDMRIDRTVTDEGSVRVLHAFSCFHYYVLSSFSQRPHSGTSFRIGGRVLEDARLIDGRGGGMKTESVENAGAGPVSGGEICVRLTSSSRNDNRGRTIRRRRQPIQRYTIPDWWVKLS